MCPNRPDNNFKSNSTQPTGRACANVSARLCAYLDGELSAAAQRRMESHLARCAACRIELARQQQAESALSAARLDAPPAGDLRADFYRHLANAPEIRRNPRRFDGRLTLPAMATAGLALLFWRVAPVAPLSAVSAPSEARTLKTATAKEPVRKNAVQTKTTETVLALASKPWAIAPAPTRRPLSVAAILSEREKSASLPHLAPNRAAPKLAAPIMVALKDDFALSERLDAKKMERGEERPLALARRLSAKTAYSATDDTESLAAQDNRSAAPGLVIDGTGSLASEKSVTLGVDAQRKSLFKNDTAQLADARFAGQESVHYYFGLTNGTTEPELFAKNLAPDFFFELSATDFFEWNPPAVERVAFLAEFDKQEQTSANSALKFRASMFSLKEANVVSLQTASAPLMGTDSVDGVDFEVRDEERGFESGSRVTAQLEQREDGETLTIEAEANDGS